MITDIDNAYISCRFGLVDDACGVRFVISDELMEI